MSRMKNKKFNVAQLASAATIHADDEGRTNKYPSGYYVLTDQATGRVTVMSPQQFAAQTETVAGVVRPRSDPFTAVVATAPATVTSQVAGKHFRANPGDYIVTNNSTGDVQVYKPGDYAASFE